MQPRVALYRSFFVLCYLVIITSCAQEEKNYVAPPTENCKKKVIDNEFIIARYNGTFELSKAKPENLEKVKWYEPNYRIQYPHNPDLGWSYLLPEKKNLLIWNELGILELWDHDIKGQEIRVGVVDTGVYTDSPFLEGRIPFKQAAPSPEVEIEGDTTNEEKELLGWNVLTESSLQQDESFHGTVIAQLIAGRAESPMGSGVAPEVQIIPVDFMDEKGGNELDAIAAIEYTIDHGAKIVNNSWSTPCSKSLREMYPEWEAQGVLLVHAAGNKGVDLGDLPESSSNYSGKAFLTVGSTDESHSRASFSNFGKTVDIFTRGTEITTIDQGYFEEGMEGQLIEVSGTSYSAAIISGIAALIWSRHPEWNNQQVKSALMSLTSEKKDDHGVFFLDSKKLEAFAN